MYNCVVVGTDGSATASKAVEVAAELAKQWKAVLHVVTAYRAAGGGMGRASGAALAGGDVGEVIQREAAEQIAAKAVEAHAKDLTVKTHAVDDHAADAILNTANQVGADLIVVGSVGMRGARRVLGSIPNSVAHGAGCAVLIVKTD
jgi:nucleotide-binding universal stress UspA family protein